MAVGVDVSRQNGVGRRAWLQGGLALGAAALAGWPGREVLAAHGMAWGGEPRYPESFAHFDYVRPDAPRGGLVRLAGMGTFDSLNPFTLRGIAADGTGTLMFESLAVASWDEPFSVYGLLAEDMILAEDRLSVMFKPRSHRELNGSTGSHLLAGKGRDFMWVPQRLRHFACLVPERQAGPHERGARPESHQPSTPPRALE